MDIKLKIKKLIDDFIKANDGKYPTKLCIPKNKINDLILFEPYPNITLSPKDAFKNGILGLKPEWNCNKKDFAVE
ncbi:MAG: hypothetical protein IPH62_00715 [Ignavibacteriae bacterium]|nr:hypothetical protein [Ignavibacteriota bacterium]